MERPRQVGAKFTNKNIAPDEKIESFELDYAGKRDRWNGYDPSTYHRVVEFYEAKEDARNKHLKKEQLRKLEETDKKKQDDVDEEDDNLDEAKVDESTQMDFAKVEKRVRTTAGGSTGTVRNLRIREDTAKYLLNLDVRSAHYDPKARSMREDPLPNDKFYSGDNAYRNSGQAQELKQMYIHSCEAFGKGYDIHTEAAPSQAEILYKNFITAKGKLKSQIKEKIMEKYGNAASEDEIPVELLLGQSERQVVYDRLGRVIKGQELLLQRRKYEENANVNNHQTVGNTGSAGIEAGLDLMNANISREEASQESPKKAAKKRMATWGTDIPEDLKLNRDSLANALNKEDKRKREEKDERKRKYNVKYNDEVTLEEMEAYRMKRVHHEDPMK